MEKDQSYQWTPRSSSLEQERVRSGHPLPSGLAKMRVYRATVDLGLYRQGAKISRLGDVELALGTTARLAATTCSLQTSRGSVEQ